MIRSKFEKELDLRTIAGDHKFADSLVMQEPRILNTFNARAISPLISHIEAEELCR